MRKSKVQHNMKNMVQIDENVSEIPKNIICPLVDGADIRQIYENRNIYYQISTFYI